MHHFSIIYIWTLMFYLELELINVICPSYESHYKNDEILFFVQFWILTIIIIIDYMVLSIQYKLIVKLNTLFAPSINVSKNMFFGVSLKIFLGSYGLEHCYSIIIINKFILRTNNIYIQPTCFQRCSLLTIL
jgi:hypothetical protein